MKKIFLLLILSFISCHNEKSENEIKLNGITNLPETNEISFEIGTQENFADVNKSLTFGLECVVNEKYFREKTADEQSENKVNDFITLVKVKNDIYNFTVGKDIYEKIKNNKCFHCRFTRPDYLFSKSYKSKVFEVR